MSRKWNHHFPFWTLFVGAVVNTGSYFGLTAFFPQYAVNFGIEAQNVGYLFSVYDLSCIITYCFGHYIARIEPKRLFLPGLFVFAVFHILQGFSFVAPNSNIFFLWNLLCRCVMGALESVLSIGSYSLFYLVFPEKNSQQGLFLGLYEMSYSGGLAIAPPFAGFINLLFGFPVPFWVYGTAGIIVALVGIVSLPHGTLSNKENESSEEGMKNYTMIELLKDPDILICSTAVAASMGCTSAVSSTLEIFMADVASPFATALIAKLDAQFADLTDPRKSTFEPIFVAATALNPSVSAGLSKSQRAAADKFIRKSLMPDGATPPSSPPQSTQNATIDGVTTYQVGVIIGIRAAIPALAAPLMGYVIRRWDCATLSLSLGLTFSALSMFTVGPVPLIPGAEKSLGLIGLSSVIGGLGVAPIWLPAFMTMMDKAIMLHYEEEPSSQLLGTVSAIFLCSFNVAGILGPVFMGWLVVPIGYAWAYAVIGCFALILLLILITRHSYNICLSKRVPSEKRDESYSSKSASAIAFTAFPND